jgi:hypothetical protein
MCRIASNFFTWWIILSFHCVGTFYLWNWSYKQLTLHLEELTDMHTYIWHNNSHVSTNKIRHPSDIYWAALKDFLALLQMALCCWGVGLINRIVNRNLYPVMPPYCSLTRGCEEYSTTQWSASNWLSKWNVLVKERIALLTVRNIWTSELLTCVPLNQLHSLNSPHPSAIFSHLYESTWRFSCG